MSMMLVVSMVLMMFTVMLAMMFRIFMRISMKMAGLNWITSMEMTRSHRISVPGLILVWRTLSSESSLTRVDSSLTNSYLAANSTLSVESYLSTKTCLPAESSESSKSSLSSKTSLSNLAESILSNNSGHQREQSNL
ncbi:GD22173 [Drosophila simulans]|uniref:GD22173 n=1 Tax=Drosophila simulans TaxID=7240 RepID=B4QAE4_DROSI|nr:GD22174 [Drosophila simulans]EDX04700.1 GD22173 [Drosophila simulans]